MTGPEAAEVWGQLALPLGGPAALATGVQASPPTTEEPLEDQAARDLVTSGLDLTVFAAAGAGSGKTRHLVERVRNLLVGGVATVEDLAVITFTEAAAGELRDRLAEELEMTHEAATERGDHPTAERARAALAGLDAAAITTLHGFARRILAEHPFDAGVPPAFDVLDDAQARADVDEHWPAMLEALLADPGAAQAVQWTLVAGARISSLHDLAREMGEHWDRLGAPARLPALELPDPGAVLRPLLGALALASSCADASDTLAVHLGRLAPYAVELDDARASGEELAVLRALTHAPKLESRLGRRAAWGVDKDEVQRLLAGAEAERARVTGDALGAAVTVLGAALGSLVVATARRRQREGRLHFHDLLVLACEVVRRSPAVRALLHRRYRRILVDEFQDTDPLQAELVTMLAAVPDAPVGRVDWWDLETTPGALFFVGDPLQSIYAFRRADIATFLRARELAGPAQAPLVTNFRSARGIVSWVNAVFGRLVAGGEPGMQPAFAPQAARADGPPGAPDPAVTVLGADAERPERARAARELEARDLAALVRRAVDEGWPAGEGGRPLSPADVAVLIPSRTSLPALERALEAEGLAYRLESSSLVYTAPEVEDLLHVLRAVDDPSDEASVVAALRTPGFGCGDDDLLAHRLAGGSWDYRAPCPVADGDDGPVRRGLAGLRELHERRLWTGVSELVAAVVEGRRQFAAALDGPRWREEWRRLRFVVDQARHFSEGSPGSLRQYLAWVDVQRREDARVSEVVLPETDTPSVAVMTVHAAKGLEFPVVAVVGFGRETPAPRGAAVLFGEDGPELSLGKSIETPGFRAARDRAAQLEAHEQLRLLYVAVTRAMHHLIVSVHHPAPRGGNGPSVAERLGAVLAHAEPWWRSPADPVPAVRAVAAQAEPTPEDAGSAASLASWEAARARRLAFPPLTVPATGVAKLVATSGSGPAAAVEEAEQDPGGLAGAPDADPASRWRRGRGGTAAGRAVHAVLQAVDLGTGEGLEAAAEREAAAEGIPGRSAEIASLARAALESDVVRAAARTRHWRELYVAVPVAGRVLEGFVDLLFEGAGGLEVVDYKTDQVDGEEDLARLASRYRLQAAAYAHAVASAVGRPVARCTLLFVRAGRGGPGAVAWPVDDLDTAVAEVVETFRDAPRQETFIRREVGFSGSSQAGRAQ